MRRSVELVERAYVVDLAWLRSTPWRERIAATFDPPAWRSALREISQVEIRHREDSAISGLLLLGWLSSRLGWKPGTLVARDGTRQGHSRAGKLDVQLTLRAVSYMAVPGLSGMTITTASGMSLSQRGRTRPRRRAHRARRARAEERRARAASDGRRARPSSAKARRTSATRAFPCGRGWDRASRD